MKNIIETQKNEGAKWHGKVCTAFFYAVMFLLLFISGIPENVAESLITLSGILMLISLVLYIRYYRNAKIHS